MATKISESISNGSGKFWRKYHLVPCQAVFTQKKKKKKKKTQVNHIDIIFHFAEIDIFTSK